MSQLEVTSDRFEFRPVHPVLRVLLVAGGVILVGLGVLAWFIPGLPSTPFLLLALAAFARSSKRLYGWLLTNRHFGPHLRTWRKERAIDLRVKYFSLAVAWLALLYLAIFVAEPLWLKAALVGLAVAKTVFMFKIKTLQPTAPVTTLGGVTSEK